MWQFDVLGETFREGELTLAQAERLEDLLDTHWGNIHPLRSAKAARHIVAVMYADRHGVGLDDVFGKLADVTVKEFLAGESSYDDLPTEYDGAFPPEAAEPPTPT